MALRYVKRKEIASQGTHTWALIGPDGCGISVFDEFCRRIKDYAYATKRRYIVVVSRFIDFLYAVRVLGEGAVTKRVVNEAIDHYLLLLRYGENISFSMGNATQKSYEPGDQRKEAALREIAHRLRIKPLKRWDNTIAALNRFLRVCENLEHEAHEIAIVRAKIERTVVQASTVDYMPLLEAIAGSKFLSESEVRHIRYASMLGGVIRYRAGELQRPRGLSAGRKRGAQQHLDVLDFPMNWFKNLLTASTTWRDRALWALLAASGIRRSEALNMTWDLIDINAEQVYVLDPDLLRYGRDVQTMERADRFKGRTVSWTYLRMPYRQQFFEILLQYRRYEYILPADGNNFVFQYLQSQYRGKPLREAADSTLNELFTDAVARAGVPPPSARLKGNRWTVHSLRHAYGMYMLNDFRVPGQPYPGLTEAEVQQLMGHKDINSTRIYARPKKERLMQKLEAHDQAVLQYSDSLEGLPSPIIKRIDNRLKTKG